MKKHLIICLACFIALSCKKEAPSEPTTSLPNIENSKSYNEAYRDSIVGLNSYGIVIMHKSGSGLRQLLQINGRCVTWSPNKWKILYSNPYELFTMNPDGSDTNKVPLQREYILFAISSPNGEQIAYVVIDTTDIYLSKGWIKVVNVDGTGSRTLTALQPTPNRVTWSSDSKRIIYNGADDTGEGLFIVSNDGTNNHKIYQTKNGLCSFPSMSRDGNTLAFSELNDSSTVKIMLLDISSGDASQLTTGPSSDDQPSWSADGQSIVYERAEPGFMGSWIGPSIWTIEKDGKNNIRATTISQGVFSPSWQQ
jgi:Tol biopolymer transport system component